MLEFFKDYKGKNQTNASFNSFLWDVHQFISLCYWLSEVVQWFPPQKEICVNSLVVVFTRDLFARLVV